VFVFVAESKPRDQERTMEFLLVLKGRLLSCHGIMFRVHHIVTKEQRFGKGKADDQGRQLVRNVIDTALCDATWPLSRQARPRAVWRDHKGARQPSACDISADLASDSPGLDFSHLEVASLLMRPPSVIPQPTAYQLSLPLIVPPIRQSHFDLRKDALRASVALCLKIGQANRFPLRAETLRTEFIWEC
jgi:hypothetical protein